MNIKQVGDWKVLEAKTRRLLQNVDNAIDKTLAKEANLFAEYARDAMVSRGSSNKAPWPPLTRWSELISGTGVPLLDRLLLYRSIRERRLSRHQHAVYIAESKYPSKPGSTGAQKTTIDVATIHENGAFFTMRMTRKMLTFLILRARELGIAHQTGSGSSGGNFVTIHIPRRSFLKSTEIAHFEDNKRQARAQRNFVTFLGPNPW